MPFLGRSASMSIGAVRLALKMDVPICFCVVTRDKNNTNHRLVIEKPFELTKTTNTSKDITDNLVQVTNVMGKYVSKFPQEYMWFYKIWKYSKQSTVVILSDGKIGHERQSQSVVRMLAKALAQRNIKLDSNVIKIVYKSKAASKTHSFLSSIIPAWISQGHLDYLKMFLTPDSYLKVVQAKADFVVSCGSSVAGLNYHFAKDHCAKAIAVLRPGISSLSVFDSVILPLHDKPNFKSTPKNVVFTKGSPNLITKEYLQEQSERLLNRYSHLKSKMRFKIGVFIGGDSANVYLSIKQMRVFVNQIKDIARQMNADILLTTSRRTPKSIESLLFRELKKDKHCPLMIQANQEDVPEAVGGMMGLSDLLIVSGDSLSMISEAASSGKKTIVFKPMGREILIKDSNKHESFAIKLHDKGYIFSTDVKHIGQTISNIIMSKIQTRKLDDNKVIFEALKHVI
ncbi:hypothetical protein MNBD_BACTEROID05-411 [hydrothermal vent metagenome]|uniref:Uncharacterized protein n=1 Tax=hydrothermal vent metagenome TaxID=652676 RepID=A0A3B0U4B1_9ZZZZ